MTHQKVHEDRPQVEKDLTKPATKVKDMEDKSLEDLVLSDLYYEIARDLPPDDVLTNMHQDNLVTDGQRDHYRMMKANNQPEVERSEYLLDCLRKGESGFLEKLCDILRRIPPASHIADKIKGKRVQIARQQSNCKPEPRADRTRKTKGETHWMIEYRKLENKTRMQLQAKDREIKRLRNAIKELENEGHTNLQRLVSEMKCQVEILSKWIDNKSETLPQSSALAKMVLSRDGKCDDIFVTSESSSNQSTLERPPRPKRKEATEGRKQHSSDLTTIDDQSDNPSVSIDNLQGYPDGPDPTVIQYFAVNVSNPPTAVESDTTDITRPLQVSKFTANVLAESDVRKSRDYPTKLVLQDHNDGHDKEFHSGSATTTIPLLNGTSIPSAASTTPIIGTTPNMSGPQDEVDLASADELRTPSTVKSDTASTTPPPQCRGKGSKPAKCFKYGKEQSLKPHQSDQESNSDFRAVFRKIRGQDPPK